jgi:hypothetical protein
MRYRLSACSFGWWLVAGAGLFREKNTAGWLPVTDLYYWQDVCHLVTNPFKVGPICQSPVNTTTTQTYSSLPLAKGPTRQAHID